MTALESLAAAQHELNEAELTVRIARRKRNQAALAAHNKGNDAPQIAKLLGVTRQRAWQMIDEARKAEEDG